MGRYVTVVLKEKYKNEQWIHSLNQRLTSDFGADLPVVFNTWQYLQEQADYINDTQEGKKQLPGWKRPITKETLSSNFFWFHFGEFSIKLSGEPTLQEAQTAVAVCKWLTKTKSAFIDKAHSENYSKQILTEYLGWLFGQHGHDIDAIWDRSE